jgi:exopolysaccharide biosynthesis polyprenyl glycosylphosphotransferase
MFKAISKRSLFLILCDVTMIFIAYALALSIKAKALHVDLLNIPPFLWLSFMIVPTTFYIFDLYYPFKHFKKMQTLIDVTLAVLVSFLILATASYIDRTILVARTLFFPTAFILVPLSVTVRFVYDVLFKSRFLDKKVLILGSGVLAQTIAKAIDDTPHSGIEVVGMVKENDSPEASSMNHEPPIIGSMSNLMSLIDWHNIEMLVLALDPKEKLSEAHVMSNLISRKVSVTSALHLYEQLTGEIPYAILDDHHLLNLMSRVRYFPYLKLKRMTDIIFSFILVLIFLPVLLLAILILSIRDSKNIFFVQKRVGLNGKLFNLYKLRTMTSVSNQTQAVTRVGKILRKYRIDEFPQLLNVLRGDMSLIGPRPEMFYFVQRSRKSIPFYDAVLAIKPGLTGWAQVHLDHVVSLKDYERKFKYNLYYLKNISLSLDLIILLRTIRVVLFGKGK